MKLMEDLDNGKYNSLLTSEEIIETKGAAQKRIAVLNEQAKIDLGMDYLKQNKEAAAKFATGELTVLELNKMVELGSINPEFGEELKRSLIEPKPLAVNPNPAVLGELYSRKAALFIKPEVGPQRIAADYLDDAAKLQLEALKSQDLTPQEKKVFIRGIQEDMSKALEAVKATPSILPKDHYGVAIKNFQQASTNPAVVNRMFREYMAQAEAQQLDREPDGGGTFDPKHWFLSTDDEKNHYNTSNKVIKAIIAREAGEKFSGLVLLDGIPNAAIGADGEAMSISKDAPTTKANTTVKVPFKIMEDSAGNKARVYEDGRVEEIK